MKTAGIIAEYNPFHTGHKYQIDHVKGTLGADYVVIAMSGDFVPFFPNMCGPRWPYVPEQTWCWSFLFPVPQPARSFLQGAACSFLMDLGWWTPSALEANAGTRRFL